MTAAGIMFSTTLLRSSILLLLALATASVNGQHHDPSAKHTSGPVDLGEIAFPTSGSPEAQKHFVRGVLLLHGFEYETARKAFIDAQQIDKDFAMVYWGEAMTYDHPIWPENDKAGGLTALAKLAPTSAERRAKAATPREKMYLDAVERLFGEGDGTARAVAYSESMAELSRRFPDDQEAKAFYSLSLLGLTRTTRNTENYMRGASVAESIYEKNPKHPGALHYLIHAYDDPVHAPLGLRAARLYGSVAKGASHAQHMPSHIFFALGMWEDSIAANTASMKTARDAGQGGYHPLHWLQHSYLQLGRNEEAAKLTATIEDDMKTSPSPYARTHLAMTRATMLVETRGNAPASAMQPVDSTGIATQGAFAGHDLAAGLEYLRRKDLTQARRMLDSIRSRRATMKGAKSYDSPATSRYTTVTQSDIDTVRVIERILDSAIIFASGDRDSGIRKAVAAAEAEDTLVFEYGPPAIVKPAWEAAGELLLAMDRKTEAVEAFRRVLKRYPNRKLSNEGLHRANSSQ